MAKPPALQAVGKSIQGEQQVEIQDTLWAADAEVDEFVLHADDGVIACRERGRHQFAPTRMSGMTFHSINREGFYVRRVPCDSCRRMEVGPDGDTLVPGLPRVIRVEIWDVKHKRDKIVRCDLVRTYSEYVDPSYLNKPGHGRMKPRQIRASVGSQQLVGQSLTALRKQILKEEEQRAKEMRERWLAAQDEAAKREVAQLSVVTSA